MKVMKRLVSLMLAIMLMAVVCIPASAVTPGDKTITINNETDGHTYQAYQIFSGTISDGVLSNVVWAEGVDAGTLLPALKAGMAKFSGCVTANDVATVLADKSWTNAETDAFAAIVANHVTGNYHTATFSTNKYTISNVPVGYYIIKDITNTTVPANDAYSKYMVHVTTDVAITAKAATPTVTKMVSLSNDSGYVDALSANIGDTVYFKVTATMHERVNDYAEYALNFKEALPTGLVFDDTVPVSVTVSGTTLLESEYATYGVNVTDPSAFAIAKAKTAIKAKTGDNPVNLSDTVVIVYAAKVTADIHIDAKNGNECKTTLQFSNNPHKADSMGSVTDSAKVYSYMLTIHKIDAASAGGTHIHLPGAKFQVYRAVGATKQYVIANYATEVIGSGKLTGWTTDPAAATTFVTTGADKGEFSIAGLGKNTYYIDETAAPASYNDINEIISVSFVAEFNKAENVVKGFNASVIGHGHADLRAVNADDGNVVVEIRNSKGAALPETGGIGTPIFYGAGFVLVVGAAALLIGRNRKSTEN